MTPRECNELYTEWREEGELPRQKIAAAEKPEFWAQLFGRLRGYGGLRWACVRLCDGSSFWGGGWRERVNAKDGTDANKYNLVQICYTIEAGNRVQSKLYWQT